jgi:photosystem II stability/assembly factor-like uncharacterized protein
LKIRIAIALLCLSALVSAAVAAAEPRGAKPPAARAAVVTGQGYFPVACRLHDGRIAVVLRGGAPHLGIKGRLDMVVSDDQGRTWSKPTVVVDSELDDRNPAFGQAKDGTLVVGFWRTATYDDAGNWDDKLDKEMSTWVTRSADGGKTWSEPSRIETSDLRYGSPYGKIVTMPDGAMLMAVYGTPRAEPGRPPVAGDWSYVYRSTDHGRTWSRFATPGEKRFNETALLRLRSGELLAAMRTVAPDQDVWLARSTDDGRTWGEAVKLTPPLVHPADLVELRDGRVLLVAGERRGPFGVRGLVATPDGGDALRRAPLFTLVDTATNGDCGYPSSVVLDDGRVLTVYYAVGDTEHAGWGEHCAAVTYEVPK